MENHNFTASLSEGKRRVEFIRSNSDWTEREADIFIKGFVEGSVWKLDTAYHQPGDIPLDGEMILCDTDTMPVICGPNHTDFCNTVEEIGIKKWAYVKDIMPCEVICAETRAIETKFKKGDVVVFKSYRKCIELINNHQFDEDELKRLMTRLFKIEDMEIDNGQVFYKLDGEISAITHIPECLLDYIGSLHQVPKANEVIPIYNKGQAVVIRSEDELRSIFGKSADLTSLVPFMGEVVMIVGIIEVGNVQGYRIRKYYGKETVYVPEVAILCGAKDLPLIESPENINVSGSISAPDAQMAQLDTSKLNPSPMQVWKEMFSGMKGFLSPASPELRAYAAGQLLGLSEQLMEDLFTKKD